MVVKAETVLVAAVAVGLAVHISKILLLVAVAALVEDMAPMVLLLRLVSELLVLLVLEVQQ
jgi:hypothetical protein